MKWMCVCVERKVEDEPRDMHPDPASTSSTQSTIQSVRRI